MTEQARGRTMQFRLSGAERTDIRRRAKAAGLKPSEYVRREALGGPNAARGLAETPAERRVEETQRAGTPPPAPGEVAAEVQEAKLTDEQAQAAFIERRTRELFAQGRTHPVAAAEARAEWKKRAA